MAGINSFPGGSGFTINNPDFVSQNELIAKNQIPMGIRAQSNDKIFVPETSSLLAGNDSVLSPMASVQQKISTQQKDPDTRYVEVAFSPQNQINKDIIDQLGYFNIGDYIGDPRQWKQNTNNYPDLDKLRDSYFKKYTKSYDLVDFINLIKFYDVSLFRMIKDFSPANVSLAAGVVVKQHMLERARVRPVQLHYENVTYSGSVGKVETFSGGPGGTMNRYQDNSKRDYFHLTQSWSEIVQTLDGSVIKYHIQEEEYYDGIFGNPSEDGEAKITAISGFGGNDCSAFTNPKFEDTKVTPVFLSDSNFTEDEFLLASTQPGPGIVWLWHDGTNVQHIKVASRSATGTDISRELAQATAIPVLLNNPSSTPFPNLTPEKTGFYSWPVLDRKIYDDYVYYAPNVLLAPNIVYSEDANIFDIDFLSTGDMIWYASASGTPANPFRLSGAGSSIPQGYFPATPSYPTEQFFRGWNGATYLVNYNEYINTRGTLRDQNGNFDTGNQEVNTALTSSEQSVYGRYTGESTLPWFMDSPQVTQSFNEITIVDLDPAATPRNIEVVALILTPQISGCPALNKDAVGQTVAVRYEGNEDLFTTNASGRAVLVQGVNGFATVRDLELFNAADPNVVYSAISITTPSTTTTTLPSGNYGVQKLSAQNQDSIIVQIGEVNGKQGIEIISYCP